MGKTNIGTIMKGIFMLLSLTLILLMVSCNPTIQKPEGESKTEAQSEPPLIQYKLDDNSKVTMNCVEYSIRSRPLSYRDGETVVKIMKSLSFKDGYYESMYGCEFEIEGVFFKYVPTTKYTKGRIQVLEENLHVDLDEETEAKIIEIYNKYTKPESEQGPPRRFNFDKNSKVTLSYSFYATHSVQLPEKDAKAIVETLNILSFREGYFKSAYLCEFTIDNVVFKFVPRTKDGYGLLQISEDGRYAELDEGLEERIIEIYEKYINVESDSAEK